MVCTSPEERRCSSEKSLLGCKSLREASTWSSSLMPAYQRWTLPGEADGWSRAARCCLRCLTVHQAGRVWCRMWASRCGCQPPGPRGGKGEGRAQHDLDEPVRWPKEAGTLLRCSKPSTRVEDIAEHSACSDAPKGMGWQPGSLTAAARQLGE